VRLRHRATGVSAIGEDSRSQSENKVHAVRRLRAAIAVHVREPAPAHASPRLVAFVAAGTAPLGERTRRTGEFWMSIAELLDVVVDCGVEIGAAAQRLGITTGALSKLLLHDDTVARAVNDLRRARGLRSLR
jgi:hypothetical protein